MDYSIIIYIIFGLLPSLVWLSYYLRKDVHPEPKKTIIRIFLWGALMTLPVFFVQIGLMRLLELTDISYELKDILYWFLIIAFSEEFFKYLVIRLKVINNPDLDEPLDIMLYMVIAALGFAAVENVLYLFTPMGQMSLDQVLGMAVTTGFIRFIGATFLHTLCSGVVGYSLAISFCRAKKRWMPLAIGILTATLLHGFYNFSIMTLEGSIRFIVPAIIIFALALLVFSGFEKLKKMKGLCKIK